MRYRSLKATSKSSRLYKDFNNIDRWLLPLLERKGLSIEEFANRCGLSRAIIYFYLHDTNRPSEETMQVMCKELGRPLMEGLAQYSAKPRERREHGVRELRARG